MTENQLQLQKAADTYSAGAIEECNRIRLGKC